MSPLADVLTGKVFGRLTVSRPADMLRGRSASVCLCTCGTSVTVQNVRLKSGKTASCGCLQVETRAKNKRTHGETVGRNPSAEYAVWVGMIGRCHNPRNREYSYYGGRGVCVSSAWRAAFEVFLKDIGRRPSASHSLDRFPDNNGNYEPENVRWATKAEQARNRRSNKIVTISGVSKCSAEWSEQLGVSQKLFHSRLRRLESAIVRIRAAQ